MKKLVLAFVFFSLHGFDSAQVPTILAHTILPVNPTSGSQYKIVTHLVTPYLSFQVDKQFTVNTVAQSIKLHLCYAEGMAAVITHQVDTFAVGQLPPGVYSVKLDAYMSNAGQHCAKVDSNFASFTFTVGGNVGLVKNFKNSKVNLFPNPAHDYITIESPDKKTGVKIYSIQGQLVRVSEISSSGTISLQGISDGVYLLEIITSEAKEVHRIIIQ